MKEKSTIEITEPRANVEVHLSDGRTLQGKRGTTIADFLTAADPTNKGLFVVAIVNGELRELNYPIQQEAHITPLSMSTADGARVYRRSLTFLLEYTFQQLFPNAKLTIDHSVSSGGYYCQVEGREPLSTEEQWVLAKRMQAEVESDRPFVREETPIDEAVQYFTELGQDDKVNLLKHRTKNYLTLYKLGKHKDYHHGYMVPSTGYLRWFDLQECNGGFVIRFPRRHAPDKLLPMTTTSQLLETFRRYGRWLTRLGIENVGALNNAIEAGRGQEIVLVSEALHEQYIADIARQIAKQRDKLRLILIAGPSSSGKTTFSRRLTVQLLALGISPFPLELDNYFVNRDETPRDENGDYDFETIEALNLTRLAEDLTKMIRGKTVQMPHYNFKTGQSDPGEEVKLHDGQLIILEGIHGMNPRLIPFELQSQAFRVYVSALTQLNLDRHNRVSTTDTRLLRRIVRDARERGYSASDTISRWESVRRGEKRHIYPYQENADVMFNSALVYELSALKYYAEPLLRQVPYGTPEHIESKRLLAFLEWFLPLDANLVPDNSLAREFLGGSALKTFKAWQGGRR